MLSKKMAFGTSFLRALAQEKAPYLVTLLFVSVGWFVTYSVGQINDSPTIEYAVRTQVLSASRNRIIVDIQNVTRKQRFQNLEFSIRLVPGDPHDKLTYYDIFTDAPGLGSPAKPLETGTEAVDFVVPDLQPGWQVHLVADHTGTRRPTFRLTSAAVPVRLVERSFETFLIRHELSTMLIVLAVYAGVIAAIVGRYSSVPASGTGSAPVTNFGFE